MSELFVIFLVLLSSLLVFNILHDIFYADKIIDFDESMLKILLILISSLILVLSIFTFNQEHKLLNVFALLSILLLFFYKRFFGVYKEDVKIEKVLHIFYYSINAFAIILNLYVYF